MKKALALMTAGILVIGSLAGCGSSSKETTAAATTTAGGTTAAQSSATLPVACCW